MIPNRQADPIGHACWWLGGDLVQVLHNRAAICRLELHSGLVPDTDAREALIRLKRLTTRNILVQQPGRSAGRIVFTLRDKALVQYFMDAAKAAPATQAQDTPKESK